MDEQGNIKTHGRLTDELNALLDEVEETTSLRTKIKNRLFNQPTLLTISSANSNPQNDNVSQWNQQGFTSFTCSFVRPALDVESVQLVSSNIPNANCNIPDSACVFWYYRLSQYSGFTPCLDNLFMVRLLPSYYKPEFCGTYGQNVFFQNYRGVAAQLTLACLSDLAADNYATLATDAPLSNIPFNANDITLTYNTTLNKFQMTGLATAPVVYGYDHDLTYAVGALVYVSKTAYISLQGTNIGNFPSTNPLYWSVYSGEIIQEWDSGTTYSKQQYVSYSGPAFDSGTTYGLNDLTFYLGIDYISLQTDNVGNLPSTSPTYWGPISGMYFSAQNSNLNNTPSGTSTYWTIVSNSNTNPNWYYYLPTGPSDPIVQQAQGVQVYQQWNATTLYQNGSRVQYNGLWYSAIQQNVGHIPASSIYWNNYAYESGDTYAEGDMVLYAGKYYVSLVESNTGNTPNSSPSDWALDVSNGILPLGNLVYSIASPARGLNWLSSQFDMVVASLPLTNNYAFPFPQGIPAQPFNPSPKRILNTILGFTWTGLFNPAWVSNAIVDGTLVGITIGFQQISFFNRFRPVLPYAIGNATLGLTEVGSSSNPVSTLLYTAESYCNLLYSSVVNLYSNFLTSGSLDTQKVNNLIACAPLAAPLGLTTFNAYVDNPITRVMPDITEMTISMFDEFGEPYYLPLSAVATLVFKLRYKE